MEIRVNFLARAQGSITPGLWDFARTAGHSVVYVKCGTHEIAVVLIQPSDVVDDVLVAELFVRLFPGERQYFPQRNGKRPHVAPRRVLVLRQHTTTHVLVGRHPNGARGWIPSWRPTGRNPTGRQFIFSSGLSLGYTIIRFIVNVRGGTRRFHWTGSLLSVILYTLRSN